MKPRLLLMLATVASTFAIAFPAPAPAADDAAPSASAAGSFGTAMLRELNRVRGRYHLPAVSADRRMNGGASGHSHSMVRYGYFAHGDWASRVARAAGRARGVGEVIGWMVQTTPQQEAASMVRSWLNSPPHRQVMLDADFRRVGIGRAGGSFAGQNAALYTVDFATPR